MGGGGNGKWGIEAGPAAMQVQAKGCCGGLCRELRELRKKVLLPSHLPVDPRNTWDFKFGALIFTSGPVWAKPLLPHQTL